MILGATRLFKINKSCDFKDLLAPEMSAHMTWHPRTSTEAEETMLAQGRLAAQEILHWH